MDDAPPELTERFLAAVALAQRVHGQARRSGTEIPYLAHLLVVTGLVIEDGGDEDQAIAAMLHDSVEDGGGRPLLEEIASTFGPRVAEIVEGLSDTLDPESSEPWIERKRRYLEHLRGCMDEGILRVGLADKVHNARSMVRDYAKEGPALWERYTQKSAREQLWYYGALLDLFGELRLGPLTEDLRRAVDDLAWLVAKDDARGAESLSLWLDPDLHGGQAPEGWVQVRREEEALVLVSEAQVAVEISVVHDLETPGLLAWAADNPHRVTRLARH